MKINTIIMACAMVLVSVGVAPVSARVKVGVASAVIPAARGGLGTENLKVITIGAQIDKEMLIETDKRGRTQVLFIDGSSMNIGPSSRIVIDSFVFDPEGVKGKILTDIQAGSLRFIGGLLSKRAQQVKFNVGKAVVGIRGGIVKIVREPSGRMRAELLHGHLSVQTPEGLFETGRIGTMIERTANGDVNAALVNTETVKKELDAEAEENFVKPRQPRQAASNDQDPRGRPAPEANLRRVAEVMRADAVGEGLVEVAEDGSLKASAALKKISPQLAKLVDEGALAVGKDGKLAPTAGLARRDPNLRRALNQGYLRVDENGLVVATARQPRPAEGKAPNADFLTVERRRQKNLVASRNVLQNNQQVAELYEQGLLTINKNGRLVSSEGLLLRLVTMQSPNAPGGGARPRAYVQDAASERAALANGAFDTRTTIRVVGMNVAANFYNAETARKVAAEGPRRNQRRNQPSAGAADTGPAPENDDGLPRAAARRIPAAQANNPAGTNGLNNFGLPRRDISITEDDRKQPQRAANARNKARNGAPNNNKGATARSYYLHFAGQRTPAGATQLNNGAAAAWTPYISEDAADNFLALASDGAITMNFAASNLLATNTVNQIYLENEAAVGSTTARNFLKLKTPLTFQASLAAKTGQKNSPAAPVITDARQTLTRNNTSTLQAINNAVSVCRCNQLATGLWTVDSFTDSALQNITYKHQGHFAIGAPLSADTIRSLAGQTVSFTGHAYGKLVDTGGSVDGLGNVTIALDFANPADATKNTWVLSNFSAGSVNVPQTTVGLSLNSNTARYSGTSNNAQINGSVYGTRNNLQTGGTFTINTGRGQGRYAVSGSFAARKRNNNP